MWVLLLLLLFPSVALAQDAITLDLGDLAIDADRVRNASNKSLWWPPIDIPDTSGWAVYSVGDYETGGCDFTNDDGDDDEPCVDTALAAALADAGSAILYFPAGTYNFINAATLMVDESNFLIRCEDPDTTTLKFQALHESTCSVSGGSSQSFISFCGGATSNTVDWIAGYEETATDITVSDASAYSIDDWMVARMNAGAGCYDNPGNNDFNHYAQIDAINGDVITIDRGLRMDYDDNGSCGSAHVDKTVFIENVGIEDCHITHTLPGCTAGNACGVYDFHPATSFEHVAYGWATGNLYEKWSNVTVRLRQSSRTVVQGNHFKDIKYVQNSMSQGVDHQRTTDSHVINNIFEANRVSAECQAGAEGIVFAHNYVVRNWPPVVGERSMFLHGKYCREVLIENNDLDISPQPDNHWGRQGPRNTWYRNRQRSTMEGDSVNCTGAGGNHCLPGVFLNLEADGALVADLMAYIANINEWMMSGTPFNVTVPSPLIQAADIDRAQTNMHLEYNVSPNFNLVNAEVTTDCGEGTGSCNDDGADYRGKNYLGDAAPGGWSGDTIPDSLYLSEAPSWWCREACNFDQTGIGAFGDDLSDPNNFCKLPAQILYESGTCTAMAAGSGTQSLSGGSISGGSLH